MQISIIFFKTLNLRPEIANLLYENRYIVYKRGGANEKV